MSWWGLAKSEGVQSGASFDASAATPSDFWPVPPSGAELRVDGCEFSLGLGFGMPSWHVMETGCEVVAVIFVQDDGFVWLGRVGREFEHHLSCAISTPSWRSMKARCPRTEQSSDW